MTEPKIYSAGELHTLPEMPPPDLVFNLSRLLDDPAHKPDAKLIELDGRDIAVQKFVFATDGATDLYWDIVRMASRQFGRGKELTVLMLCRGGKHRSVAFAERLGHEFYVKPVHHHVHLDRVVSAG